MEVKKKLLDIVRDKIRFKHYSIKQALRAQERKYPNVKFETKWQFLFPMRNVAKDPRSEVVRLFQR